MNDTLQSRPPRRGSVTRERPPVPQTVLWVLFGLLTLAALVLGLLLFLRGRANARLVQQHLDLGEKYLAQLDYDSAVIEFTSAIRIDERCAPAYQGRGDAYLALADYESAEADYTVVIEVLRQPSVDLYVDRARAHAGQDEVEQAEADLQHAADMGLSEDELTQIRDEIFVTLPLTAEDVTWLVEPSYDYLDISPLPVEADSFWAWHSDSFSPLPQYYQAAVRVNAYGFTDSDILDMETDQTLSGTASQPEIYAFYPNVVAAESPYLYFGDMGNIDSIYNGEVISPTFAGGNYTFGAMNGAYNQSGFVLDPASGLFYGETHNIASGPPYTEFTTFAEVVQQISLQKPVPVCRWDLSSVNPIIPGASYLPAQDYSPSDPDIPIAANPDRSAYAFLSPEGQLITDFAYEDVVDFSEGVAAVKQNGKWAYLDESGALLTDFVYDSTWPYGTSAETSRAFPCTCSTMVVSRGGQMGLLYRDGSLLLDFGQFEDLAPAYNDQLWAKQNGLWGRIDLASLKAKAGLPAE
ncbi:WG repeat-containing protein [uncultured Gemmiger sp.]|uniref:WG repeat-containing protein n=1 Tax=uncultured Gemmiger sp. TaxID=1623490 RepID=UPI0025F51DA0|nr:WG repeat-containing protein [uncultured Gemmiger sp.]